MSNVEHIRDSNPMPQLVSEFTEVKSVAGKDIALCPFHDDTKPSMSMFKGRAGHWMYKCHACGEAGDTFSFVQKMLGLNFKESLKWLSDRSGVAVKPGAIPFRPNRHAMFKAIFSRQLRELEQAAKDTEEMSGAAQKQMDDLLVDHLLATQEILAPFYR